MIWRTIPSALGNGTPSANGALRSLSEVTVDVTDHLAHVAQIAVVQVRDPLPLDRHDPSSRCVTRRLGACC
jgi:hypothetical protein